MRKNAILEQRNNSGTKPSIFMRITEGPPLVFGKSELINVGEENKVITNFFESRFEDSIEAISGIISILPAMFAKEYQARHVIRDYAGKNVLKTLL